MCAIEDITYDSAPSPQKPVQYTNGLIECRVSGQPIPTVSWRYRGRRLHTGILLQSCSNTFQCFFIIHCVHFFPLVCHNQYL